MGYDDGAKSVTVKSHDTIKPAVSISVDHASINLGDPVVIKYIAKDSGGAGLNKAELWRGTDKNSLGPVNGQTSSLSGKGDGPVTATFTDRPTSAVTYYYGIHVIDGAGNVGYDNGALQVKVQQSTPNVTGITNPASITAGQSALFKATTDHSATKVILRFTDANIEVSMSGNGMNWSVNPVIGNAGNRPFTVTAYDANGKAGSSKNGSIQVKSQETTKLNGWQTDGETAFQKRIVAAARALNKQSSGQSVVGSGHQTDIDGGDGDRMLNAINIYDQWKKNPGTKNETTIKGDMRKAFSKSAYGTNQVNALVDRIIAVYNPKNLPGSNSAVLSYLGIRKQCHEWADSIGGGEDKGTLGDLKKVRPGMGLFTNLPHVMIITDVNWNNGTPTQFKVCEANWATGWANPSGAVPWERTVSCGRTVSANDGTVRKYE